VSERRSVPVEIRGKQFRILSEEDPAALQRIAEYVDATMEKIEARTGAIDSLDVAMLTALNLARELVSARDQQRGHVSDGRLRRLIDLAESGLVPEVP
jgi:cell division protein ZapA (FtsZ GTPase activity inhibitor)